MQDPFFNYLAHERKSPAQSIYRQGESAKSYDRFPRTILPDAPESGALLKDVLAQRCSMRVFDREEPLTIQQISALLKYAAGPQPASALSKSRRAHPSGGAKYPLEIYPVIFNGKDIPPGAYHYHVGSHALEHLVMVDYPALLTQLKVFIPASDFKEVQLFVLFSFIKTRSMEKYGGLAYKLALLEAGHISENLYLLAAAYGIGCCGLGLSTTRWLNPALELDGVNEIIIYGMVFGSRTP